MITIIDYGNTNSKELKSALSELTGEIIISNKEADILKADKLILPDSEDFSASIRKLHLLNLFSVLRMIKKPSLGIGTGMHLMTKSYKNINAACLGCFPVECRNYENSNNDFLQSPVKILKKSDLLKDIREDDLFHFRIGCYIPLNEFSTSSVKTNKEITASIEKDHLFGVQFNPEKPGEAGMKIFQNFLAL
jgi:imidazole glycerol-phosphate synthase subunit HisH